MENPEPHMTNHRVVYSQWKSFRIFSFFTLIGSWQPSFVNGMARFSRTELRCWCCGRDAWSDDWDEKAKWSGGFTEVTVAENGGVICIAKTSDTNGPTISGAGDIWIGEGLGGGIVGKMRLNGPGLKGSMLAHIEEPGGAINSGDGEGINWGPMHKVGACRIKRILKTRKNWKIGEMAN